MVFKLRVIKITFFIKLVLIESWRRTSFLFDFVAFQPTEKNQNQSKNQNEIKP